MEQTSDKKQRPMIRPPANLTPEEDLRELFYRTGVEAAEPYKEAFERIGEDRKALDQILNASVQFMALTVKEHGILAVPALPFEERLQFLRSLLDQRDLGEAQKKWVSECFETLSITHTEYDRISRSFFTQPASVTLWELCELSDWMWDAAYGLACLMSNLFAEDWDDHVAEFADHELMESGMNVSLVDILGLAFPIDAPPPAPVPVTASQEIKPTDVQSSHQPIPD